MKLLKKGDAKALERLAKEQTGAVADEATDAGQTMEKRIEAQKAFIASLDAEGLKQNLPEFRAGDRVRVHVRVVEGEKSRIQVFEGDVIARSGGAGLRATFTVRKTSGGVGVERIFPLHSPNVEKIEVIRHGRVRRAKLYYLRDLRGKKARIRERRVR